MLGKVATVPDFKKWVISCDLWHSLHEFISRYIFATFVDIYILYIAGVEMFAPVCIFSFSAGIFFIRKFTGIYWTFVTFSYPLSIEIACLGLRSFLLLGVFVSFRPETGCWVSRLLE